VSVRLRVIVDCAHRAAEGGCAIGLGHTPGRPYWRECAGCASRVPTVEGRGVAWCPFDPMPAAAPAQPARVAWTPEQLDLLHELWAWLHARPWRRRRSPRRELRRLALFERRIPCGRCRAHFSGWRRALTIADLADAERYFRRTWELHENVNAKLGKLGVEFAAAAALHRPTT
jgi:hypothetical protein